MDSREQNQPDPIDVIVDKENVLILISLGQC
jgi:hypothetical protein